MRFGTWYAAVSTLFGLGHHSRMPGTLGSLAALVPVMIAGGIHIAAIVAVMIIGTIASHIYAREKGKDDPGEVIIDEVAGMWVSMYGLDASFGFVAFFLFRVVDIFKPFPVSAMERLPGGVGIMADDICGGVIVNVLLRALYWVFFDGGYSVIHTWLGMGG